MVPDAPLHPLVAAWRDRLALEQRRSVHTVRAYLATAQRLCDFLGHYHGAEVDAAMLGALGPADLRAFLAGRRGEGLSNASAARELSAVRGFLRFASGEGAAVPQVRGPRVRRGLPRPVSPDEAVSLAEDVAESAREPWMGARDFALLMLLYGAGLRIGEALSLTGAALDAGEVLRVTGKRGKTRVVPLIGLVREALAEYAAQCPHDLSKSAARCRARGGGWGWASGPRRTRCATASRRTCWLVGPTCAACRSCSATPACPRPRSIPQSMSRGCWTSMPARIRAPERLASPAFQP
jgi:integrase/recombinase XerC